MATCACAPKLYTSSGWTSFNIRGKFEESVKPPYVRKNVDFFEWLS
jgi:hypothetical protein